MTETFYSSKDGYLFLIAGYTADLNTFSVEAIIKSLSDHATRFAQWSGVHPSQVQTYKIQKNSRYENMRVFYAKSTTPPEDAYQLGPDWEMTKWIHD
jgi:hypothetical protein